MEEKYINLINSIQIPGSNLGLDNLKKLEDFLKKFNKEETDSINQIIKKKKII